MRAPLAWTLACAAFGAGFALCAPPTDLVPLVWLGLAGLAFAIAIDLGPREGRRAWLDGGARGLAFGFGANVVALRFVPAVIARFTPLPWAVGVVALILLALAQGLPWGLAAIVANRLARLGVPRAIAFAIAVYGSSFVPCIFPWTPAGGVTIWPAMVQFADAIGERGVAALIALAAGLLADGARLARVAKERRLAGIFVGAGLLLPCITAGLGALRMDAIEERRRHVLPATIGLVEPSIPATTRWDPAAAPSILEGLTRWTDLAEQHGAMVTVWPESAYPYVVAHGAAREPLGAQQILRRGVRGPLLIGAVTQNADGERYNSVIGVEPDGRFTPPYDKLHLLWFGEQVPLAGAFPWMRRTFARGLGLIPGDAPVRVDVGGRVKAGVMICYEDTLPEASREAAGVGANLLVNVSNDGWFVGSQESELHLRLSVLRAIEARRDLVRAVNLGPTSFVDAAGRIAKRYDPVAPGALVVDAALLEGTTPYAALGDWPCVLAFGAIAWAFAAHKRRRAPTP